MKRVSLELGGKSPSIIFPDADLEAATAAAAMGVWGASGQVCTCGTRVLVHESIHDEVTSMIVERSRGMRIGGGFDPEVDMGPLVSADQLARVQRYVQLGRDEGAELALGGERHGERGFFHEPTVFTGVRNDMTIAQEEIFGPVMSILSFSTEEEAYRIANDTEFGLAAGVWTSDLRPGASRRPRAPRRDRLGQHLPDGLPVGALRRREAVRPRPQPRRGVDRGAHADQEPLDEGGVMSATVSADPAVRALQDRADVTDVLYRYASTIDRFDFAGLRACWPTTSSRSTATPIRSTGGDAVAEWIGAAIAEVVWQHHFLSVYHVEVEGDRANALVYHTSHQVFEADPDAREAARRPLRRRAAARGRRLEDQPPPPRPAVGRGARRRGGLPASVGGRGPGS